MNNFATLTEFGKFVAERAGLAMQLHGGAGNPLEHLAPGEDQCRFCPVKATCPALADTVRAAFDTVPKPDHTTAPDVLANAMEFVGLVEIWAKGVRAEVERRLLGGETVDGYKLVEGRAGNREWSDAKEAENIMKSLRLRVDEMYDLKLISPTTAEKLRKSEKLGPRQWVKLQQMIVRNPGKPTVAPASDARPAINPGNVAGSFDLQS